MFKAQEVIVCHSFFHIIIELLSQTVSWCFNFTNIWLLWLPCVATSDTLPPEKPLELPQRSLEPSQGRGEHSLKNSGVF